MPPKPSAADSDDEFDYDAPPPAATKSSPLGQSSSLPRNNPLKSSHLGLPRKVLDQPYDEAVDISASSADSVMSADPSPINGRVVKEPTASAGGKVLSMDSDEEEEGDEEDDDDDVRGAAMSRPPAKAPVVTVTAPLKTSPLASPKTGATLVPPPNKRPLSESEADEDDEEEDEESDEERGAAVRPYPHTPLVHSFTPSTTHSPSFRLPPS